MADRFDFDAAIADESGTPFTFDGFGQSWTLPNMSDLSLRQVRQVDSGLDGFIQVIRDVDADLADKIDSSPARALEPFMKAWAAHAGVTLGESAASSS